MNIAKPGPMNQAKPPDNPFLICIPYWEGDRNECRSMTDLMVDLEPKHAGHECKVMLCRRQDCEPDETMLNKIRTRFDTEDFRCTSPLRGYPAGSNGQFSSTALNVANSTPQYSGWLWMEPDCVPMYPGWWRDLRKEWMSRGPGVKIMGWKGDCNGDGTGWHITGCAIHDQQFARAVPGVTQSDLIAWDYQHRAKILAVSQETSKIHLCWRAHDAQVDIFFKHYAMVHGYKDGSLRRIVREKFIRT